MKNFSTEEMYNVRLEMFASHGKVFIRNEYFTGYEMNIRIQSDRGWLMSEIWEKTEMEKPAD